LSFTRCSIIILHNNVDSIIYHYYQRIMYTHIHTHTHTHTHQLVQGNQWSLIDQQAYSDRQLSPPVFPLRIRQDIMTAVSER